MLIPKTVLEYLQSRVIRDSNDFRVIDNLNLAKFLLMASTTNKFWCNLLTDETTFTKVSHLTSDSPCYYRPNYLLLDKNLRVWPQPKNHSGQVLSNDLDYPVNLYNYLLNVLYDNFSMSVCQQCINKITKLGIFEYHNLARLFFLLIRPLFAACSAPSLITFNI